MDGKDKGENPRDESNKPTLVGTDSDPTSDNKPHKNSKAESGFGSVKRSMKKTLKKGLVGTFGRMKMTHRQGKPALRDVETEAQAKRAEPKSSLLPRPGLPLSWLGAGARKTSR